MEVVLLDDISQAQQERLFHIDFKLRFLGAISRADLVTRFGIKAAAATRDLSLYKELAPKNLQYDTKAKTYKDAQVRGIQAEQIVRVVQVEPVGITARPPANSDGSLKPDLHIEVKGQDIITVSRNEILYALNQAEKFWLAIVIVDGGNYEGPYYVKNPFTVEPDFGVPSVNYELKYLLSKAESPGGNL